MTKHDMEFIYPEWSIGLNSTVRLGANWGKKVDIGDIIHLKSTEYPDEPVKEVIAVGVMIMPFNMIPAEIIRYQHSFNTRYRTGLVKVLDESYGIKFSEREICSVILFEA